VEKFQHDLPPITADFMQKQKRDSSKTSTFRCAQQNGTKLPSSQTQLYFTEDKELLVFLQAQII
jgi:hypothetical protein